MHSDAAPKLTFDRGTIVVRSPASFDPSGLPGVVWDERIGGWRAPAHRLCEIRSQLGRNPTMGAADDAAIQSSSRWRTIDLRPYQKAALAAWAMNGHRGVSARAS